MRGGADQAKPSFLSSLFENKTLLTNDKPIPHAIMYNSNGKTYIQGINDYGTDFADKILETIQTDEPFGDKIEVFIKPTNDGKVVVDAAAVAPSSVAPEQMIKDAVMAVKLAYDNKTKAYESGVEENKTKAMVELNKAQDNLRKLLGLDDNYEITITKDADMM
jgi:hypothetical protein